MERERKDNLMMVAAYYDQAYRDAISDTIDAEKLKELNIGLDEVQVFLKTSRSKLHSLEHHGREHTMSFYAIYQKLDTFIEDLEKVKKLVNKTGTRINLEDYPI